jgi:hypothetical protein
LISRVIEKTALYTLLTLQHVLDVCLLRGLMGDDITTVVLWSDAGGHYRSSRNLGAITKHFPTKYKKDFEIRFGLEKHAKSEVDGYFARVQHRLSLHETTAWLRTTGDVVQCLQDRAAARAVPTDDELFVDYLPLVTKGTFAVMVPWIDLGSLPGKVRQVHCWRAQRNDRRRVSMLGADMVTLTGIDLKCSCLPHMAWDSVGSWHPRISFVKPLEVGGEHLAPELEEMEDDDNPPEPTISTSSAVPMGCTQVDGWRTSWRSTEPEVPNLVVSLARLRWKHRPFLTLRLPPAQRHAPMQPAEVLTQIKEKKRKAATGELAVMRKLRFDGEPAVAELGGPDPEALGATWQLEVASELPASSAAWPPEGMMAACPAALPGEL